MRMIDEDEVGLKEKTLDTSKRLHQKKAGQETDMNFGFDCETTDFVKSAATENTQSNKLDKTVTFW